MVKSVIEIVIAINNNYTYLNKYIEDIFFILTG